MDLTIRPLTTEDDVERCAQLMATSDPWVTLKRDYAQSRRLVLDESRERYVAYRGAQFAGFLILNLKGSFVGYIQTVGVTADLRGQGIGEALIAFAETRLFRDFPNVFLCVSAFNAGARRLYARLGYAEIGVIKDFLVAGQDEILLRKTRGPIAAFFPGSDSR